MDSEWTPEFNEAIAKTLLGKYVLVGVTSRDKTTDAVEGYQQMHGEIVSVHEEHGIIVRNPQSANRE
jgi:hypothetical protein